MNEKINTCEVINWLNANGFQHMAEELQLPSEIVYDETFVYDCKNMEINEKLFNKLVEIISLDEIEEKFGITLPYHEDTGIVEHDVPIFDDYNACEISTARFCIRELNPHIGNTIKHYILNGELRTIYRHDLGYAWEKEWHGGI